MIDTHSDFEHSVITVSEPLVPAEFFVASGYAKIRSIELENKEELVGFITPKCESNRAALNALADKLSQYPELKELAKRLRMSDVGGVVFN